MFLTNWSAELKFIAPSWLTHRFGLPGALQAGRPKVLLAARFAFASQVTLAIGSYTVWPPGLTCRPVPEAAGRSGDLARNHRQRKQEVRRNIGSLPPAVKGKRGTTAYVAGGLWKGRLRPIQIGLEIAERAGLYGCGRNGGVGRAQAQSVVEGTERAGRATPPERVVLRPDKRAGGIEQSA